MYKKILWLGPLHSDHALATRKAPNQAAAKWTRGLIGGFKANGVEVIGLTHSYEQAWPKGVLFPGSSVDFDDSIEFDWCRYPNIKGFIRDWSLEVGYSHKIKRIIKEKGVEALVCYNVKGYPYHVKAMSVAHKMGIPCFALILDGDDPRLDQWKWVVDGTKNADGIVFLSDWMTRNYPGKQPVLHMDGGCSAWFGDDALVKTEKTLIVYSGGLDHWRGLDFLVEVIKLIKNQDCRFIICGKCDREAIHRRMGNDPRVEVKGFVSDEELHDICLRASLFLNTRNPNNGDNILNFPSKIPNYLAYGKPVVSTWLSSLSNDYRLYLQVVEPDDPLIFARRVEEILAWSDKQSQTHYRLLKEWFVKNKLWNIQAERFKNWMNSI